MEARLARRRRVAREVLASLDLEDPCLEESSPSRSNAYFVVVRARGGESAVAIRRQLWRAGIDAGVETEVADVVRTANGEVCPNANDWFRRAIQLPCFEDMADGHAVEIAGSPEPVSRSPRAVTSAAQGFWRRGARCGSLRLPHDGGTACRFAFPQEGRSPLWLSHRGRTIAALLLLCLAYTVVAAGVSLWRYRTCRTNWALDHANFTHSIHAIANLNPEVTLVSGDAGPHTARHDHFPAHPLPSRAPLRPVS